MNPLVRPGESLLVAEWRGRAQERFYDGLAVGFGAGMIAAFALAWLT